MPVKLNSEQQAVVQSDASRIVVSAGAGSGKTRTLVERFVDRVLRMESQEIERPLQRILLITFTEKAAGELVERVRARLLDAGRPDLAREVDDSWISTIHGFCNRIVRRHALELGVDPAFTVLAETESGLARTRSFEAAAVSLLDDPDVAELIESCNLAILRDSVLSGHDTVRSKGLQVTDVAPTAPGDIKRALRALVEATGRLLPEYRSVAATDTALDNIATFELRAALAAEALGLLGDGVDDRDPAVRGALVAIADTKTGKRGSERAQEIIAELGDAAWNVHVALLDCCAARWSAAWIRLLGAFDEAYTGEKDHAGAVDFEDMQLLTRRLWIQRPEAAARYAGQFIEVMIDEFQDTNRLQVEATEPVIGERACYVGDVQQSIYGFRDADVTLLRDLFAGAQGDGSGEACRLTVNYRTHPAILSAINRMFADPIFTGQAYQHLAHDAPHPSAVDWPADRPRVEVIVADKTSCDSGTWRDVEASALADRLREIVDAGWAKAGDIVVLIRAATKMGVYAAALKSRGFDVLAPAAGGLYNTREVADVRALLKVLVNPGDTEGIVGLLAGGFGGVSDDGLVSIMSRKDGPWAAMGAADALPLSPADTHRVRLIHTTLERLRELQGRIRLADAILHAAGVLGAGGGLLEEPSGWANVQKVARLAADFEMRTPADPGACLEYLAQRELYVKKEAVGVTAVEGADAVRIMTVHAAKGLEFPVVAVADLGHAGVNCSDLVVLAESRGATVAALQGPKELRCGSGDGSTAWRQAVSATSATDREEENRVFYVACTRAEQALVLAGSCDPAKLPADGTMIQRVLSVIGLDGTEDTAVTVVDGSGAGERVEACGETPDPGHSASFTKSVIEGEQEQGGERPADPLPTPVDLAPPREMSYTAFALYESCAYRFFAERMLGVGTVEPPRDEDPLAFGSALHAAMELLSDGEQLDDDRLRALAKACRLTERHIGRLRTAVDAVAGSGVRHCAERGRPEVDFAVCVSDVVVRGSMDLLVQDGDLATVLDYKSGSTWDAEEGRYRAQAEVYAFALLSGGVDRVEVRFVHVEAGCEQEVFRFTHEDRSAIQARLESALARMRAGEFPRLGAFHERYCADCPVSGSLCPVVHPGRRSGGRGDRRPAAR